MTNLSSNSCLPEVLNTTAGTGIKIAYGTETGAATPAVATGLSEVLWANVCFAGDPVDTCQEVTVELASTAGSIDISTWKMTAADNGALVAATTPFVDIFWIAIGR
ncbi:MAG: hypothetical protein GY856_36810 [bacterium]|nr:hypothetical protein [bacterium]